MGFLISVDNKGGGYGLKHMIILFIDGILMAVIMLQRPHQARLGADQHIILKMIEEHIAIFIIPHNLTKAFIKSGSEVQRLPYKIRL